MPSNSAIQLLPDICGPRRKSTFCVHIGHEFSPQDWPNLSLAECPSHGEKAAKDYCQVVSEAGQVGFGICSVCKKERFPVIGFAAIPRRLMNEPDALPAQAAVAKCPRILGSKIADPQSLELCRLHQVLFDTPDMPTCRTRKIFSSRAQCI